MLATRMKAVSGWINAAAGAVRHAHPARPFDEVVGEAIQTRAAIHELPAFDVDGKLPVGIHDADLGSFLLRVGGNGHREALYGPFGDRLLQMQKRGVREVFVAGSGISAKAMPGDVDSLFHVVIGQKPSLRERVIDWAHGTHWHGAERRHFAPQTSWGAERPTWLEYFSHYSTKAGTHPVAVVRVLLDQHPATAGVHELNGLMPSVGL